VLTAKAFDAQALRGAVTTVFGGTATFFVSHGICLPYLTMMSSTFRRV
jgi:hypothetical protein